jgi:lipopolysaccharide export LptBFGC system permease protein LptF
MVQEFTAAGINVKQRDDSGLVRAAQRTRERIIRLQEQVARSKATARSGDVSAIATENRTSAQDRTRLETNLTATNLRLDELKVSENQHIQDASNQVERHQREFAEWRASLNIAKNSSADAQITNHRIKMALGFRV